eukprot:TRINITY_DN8588_c0_g1_i1.p1 TRINITY_DN8588_c0_g1~~TRINITY_DN8588_c0_g1_i1.p1  ORF type:complete len:163 (+),score=31.52 TRINITY_DN8588_c0_g1_i1:102-590(+)
MERHHSGSRDEPPDEEEEEDWGTVREVMIRNIPSRCREHEILSVVAQFGFANQIQKFYLPLRRSGQALFNRGYAFIGFNSPEAAFEFGTSIRNYAFRRGSTKAVTAHPVRVSSVGGSAFQHALVSIVQDCTPEQLIEQVRRFEARRAAGREGLRLSILRTSL